MRNLKRFAVGLIILAVFLAGRVSGWWAGFNDGADAAICVMQHNIDGKEAAMKTQSCKNIAGQLPPPDLFGQKAN